MAVNAVEAKQGKWGNNSTSSAGANQNGTNQNGYCSLIIADMPFENVDDTEKADLIYMREEEKLARDLYQSFYEKWGTRIFNNIAGSEQKHTDSIKALLTKYEITDPITNDKRGFFTDSDLQQIYNDLLTSGNISFLDALKVGAAVEELDISDLKEALGKTDNQDIQAVYQNLMKGSRNHLRSYVNMLHNYGESYHAVYLTSEEAAEIIDAPMERGFY
ncbi:MAG: DUF2202 domain-containing protein [Desulfamplus sp.]|nr:DUF2202 domain-containing protein [Desulfamplus sp.]